MPNPNDDGHNDIPEEEAFITWQIEQYSDAGTLEQACPVLEAVWIARQARAEREERRIAA